MSSPRATARVRFAAYAHAFVRASVCVCGALVLLAGCSASSGPGEHTATVVRGTYGDPNPLVGCDTRDGGGGADATGAADAAPDGC